MNVNGSVTLSGDNTCTHAHKANVSELNQPWEIHAQLNATKDWATKAKETAVNMMGPQGAEMFDQSPIGLFEDFNVVAKVRKTEDSAESNKAQAQLMLMMCDAFPPLADAPFTAMLREGGENGLNCDGLDWAASKEKLKPMIQGMGMNVSQFPFVGEFVNNWCENVKGDVQTGVCYQTRQFSYKLKSEG